MRVTKGHSGNRRAHHSLKAARLSVCSNCGAKHERHKVCLECGFYKGKEVLEIKSKKALVTKAEGEKVEEKAVEKTKTEKKSKDSK
jgi:large subunit ribosomal protein L32